MIRVSLRYSSGLLAPMTQSEAGERERDERAAHRDSDHREFDPTEYYYQHSLLVDFRAHMAEWVAAMLPTSLARRSFRRGRRWEENT